ncbi:MAG: YHYH protein [Pirellulales bacterium]|jgi:hypothetical protein
MVGTKPLVIAAAGLVIAATLAGVLGAQPPMLRRHTATSTRPLALVPADRQPPAANRVSITVEGDDRVIRCNDMPSHRVGAFPNRGNPHSIAEQTTEVRLPAQPQVASAATMLHDPSRRGPPLPFGIGVNGVLFDPGAAEFWMGDRAAGWNYEALGGAVALGLDTNHAHVQPGGLYHYHGLPTGLLAELGFNELTTDTNGHSPLIGWAADGFPIYCLFGYTDGNDPQSGISKLTSSYRLKDGMRPGGSRGPGGSYDGAFVQDYNFVAGAGDLDECNGRMCITPEFPRGTYAYFLTEDWPVIPRGFRGTPISLKGPPGTPPQGPSGRRPPPR